MTANTIGQRMTSQRKLLLDIIRGSIDHLNADEIYRLARERDKRISLSTVYRNLSLLKETGYIAERRLGDEQHYYELNIAPQHHHLVCTECGKVFEFESQFTAMMKDAVEAASQFTVTHIEIDMKGYCSKCKERCNHNA